MKKIRTVVATLTTVFGISAVLSGVGAIATDWASLAKTSSLYSDMYSACDSAEDFQDKKNSALQNLAFKLDSGEITEEEYIKQCNHTNSNLYKREVVYDLNGVSDKTKNNFEAREQEILDLENSTPIIATAGVTSAVLCGAFLATENAIDKKIKKQEQLNQQNEQNNSSTLDL